MGFFPLIPWCGRRPLVGILNPDPKYGGFKIRETAKQRITKSAPQGPHLRDPAGAESFVALYPYVCQRNYNKCTQTFQQA